MTSESFTQNLLPALTQCFGIILIGYLFGKSNILHPRAAKGLFFFIFYLSLPALIFTTIATIPFSNIKWAFISAVFVTKCLVFITVAITTMILTKPVHLGKSGLYAIVTTQSNDLALGYPLFVALYKNSHSNYPYFLYIIAPIQLLILNPIGFFLLELYKQKRDFVHSEKHSFFDVFKGICTNPIIIMTVLGIIWNFAFNHYVPLVISQLLDALSASFAAIALFLVGYNMAQRVGLLKGKLSLTTTLLILTKILILPLVMQKVITLLLQGSNEQEVQDLSNLGFLYGTLPCAPSIFVFASQYDVAVDITTSTTIFSTFFSAPLMITSATMISLTDYSFKNVKFYLAETIGFTSVCNLFCCTWLLFTFFISKRWHAVSFGVTIYIIIAQFFMSIGGILLLFTNESSKSLFYVQYVMSTAGMFSSHIFAAFLAVLLFLLQWRNLCFILRARYIMNVVTFIITFGSSFIGLTASVWLVDTDHNDYDPHFPLGHTQIIATLIVTATSLIVTSSCLILQHKYKSSNCCDIETFNSKEYSSETTDINSTIQTENYDIESNHNINSDEGSSSTVGSVDVEDIGINFACNKIRSYHSISNTDETNNFLCDSHFSCSIEQKRKCSTYVQHYKNTLRDTETSLSNNHQILKHIILLLSLSASMFISLAICLWKLVTKSTNGIYIELEFLDSILNYGQGIICFIIFGLDCEILRPVFKYLKCFRRQNNNTDNLRPETVTACQQFEKYHRVNCMQQIGKKVTVDNVVHQAAFAGCDLVDWLIEVGLAHKRNQAEEYGKHLLQGCVIEHINKNQHFCDNMYIYKFIV